MFLSDCEYMPNIWIRLLGQISFVILCSIAPLTARAEEFTEEITDVGECTTQWFYTEDFDDPLEQFYTDDVTDLLSSDLSQQELSVIDDVLQTFNPTDIQ